MKLLQEVLFDCLWLNGTTKKTVHSKRIDSEQQIGCLFVVLMEAVLWKRMML